MTSTPLTITPLDGGWIYADWGDGGAWVRFQLDNKQKIRRITDVHVANPTVETLRRLPLNRIEAAVTSRGAGAIQFALTARYNEEPDLSEMFKKPPKGGAVLTSRFRLERPKGRRLDDAFYADVAHAYRSAAAWGLNPRKAIVEDTDAADATVARWVMEARSRDLLPAASPGKVSA